MTSGPFLYEFEVKWLIISGKDDEDAESPILCRNNWINSQKIAEMQNVTVYFFKVKYIKFSPKQNIFLSKTIFHQFDKYGLLRCEENVILCKESNRKKISWTNCSSTARHTHHLVRQTFSACKSHCKLPLKQEASIVILLSNINKSM